MLSKQSCEINKMPGTGVSLEWIQAAPSVTIYHSDAWDYIIFTLLIRHDILVTMGIFSPFNPSSEGHIHGNV